MLYANNDILIAKVGLNKKEEKRNQRKNSKRTHRTEQMLYTLAKHLIQYILNVTAIKYNGIKTTAEQAEITWIHIPTKSQIFKDQQRNASKKTDYII